MRYYRYYYWFIWTQLMTIQELQTKREGKRYQENADYWYQCVARAKMWVYDLYGVKLWSFGGTAWNWWNTWSPFTSDRTKQLNTYEAIPSPWDVVFRDNSWNLPMWHVAIVVSAELNRLVVMEQNAITGDGKWLWWDVITTRTLTYSWISWWYSYNKKVNEKDLIKEIITLNSKLYDSTTDTEIKSVTNTANIVLRMKL